jgi:hypothetical protein
MREMRNVYKILVRKHEGKRSLGRPKHRWEDNIRMNLSKISWENMHWTHLAQNRDQWWDLLNTVTNFWIP